MRGGPRIAMHHYSPTPAKVAGEAGSAEAPRAATGTFGGASRSGGSGSGPDGLPPAFHGYVTENSSFVNHQTTYGNPDNSAQKLRQTILNTRRGPRNVWMGGSTAPNPSGPLAPIEAPSSEYGQRQLVGMRAKPGLTYVTKGGEVLWSGPRASVAQ